MEDRVGHVAQREGPAADAGRQLLGAAGADAALQLAQPPSKSKITASEGITVRHGKACRTREQGRCNCSPTWQAQVWSRRDRKRITKTFPTLSAAKGWRRDALTALERGTIRAPTPTTVREAAEAYVAGMRDGTIRTREGDVFKPWTIRSYEKALRLRVLPALGDLRLSDLRPMNVQDFADQLLADGHSPSTTAATLSPLS